MFSVSKVRMLFTAASDFMHVQYPSMAGQSTSRRVLERNAKIVPIILLDSSRRF